MAERDFSAGGFMAAAYFAREDGRSDSYNLGYDMAARQLVHSPPNS
jgi:hypothetical protein